MTIVLGIFLGLILSTMIGVAYFTKWVLPLFYRNKWKRKEMRIICDRKMPLDDVVKKYYEISKEKQKEQKMLLRKEKLKKLNSL